MEWRKEALSGQIPGLAPQKGQGSERAFPGLGCACILVLGQLSQPLPHSPSRDEVEKVVSCEYAALEGEGHSTPPEDSLGWMSGPAAS